jgi:hypothetical protein
MNSTNTKLTSAETISYHTRCHWALFLGPLIVIVIGGLAIRAQGMHALALMVFGLIWFGFAYVSFNRSDLALTSKRTIIHGGFPLPRSYDIPLSKITAIDFYQPSLGSMLNFGKIIIVYNQRMRCVVRFVSSPAEFVTKVRQQIILTNPS